MRSAASGNVVNRSRGKPANAESVVFRTTRLVEAGDDLAAPRIAGDDRGPLLTARLHECMRVRPAVDRQSIPAVLDRADSHAGDVRRGDEMVGQAQRKRFDVTIGSCRASA